MSCASSTLGSVGASPSEDAQAAREAIARGGEFVRRRVEAGEAAFVEMWESMGGSGCR